MSLQPGGGSIKPGLWHSHHNETDAPAHVLPIQDAGLHMFLQTFDIRLSRVGADGKVVVNGNALSVTTS